MPQPENPGETERRGRERRPYCYSRAPALCEAFDPETGERILLKLATILRRLKLGGLTLVLLACDHGRPRLPYVSTPYSAAHRVLATAADAVLGGPQLCGGFYARSAPPGPTSALLPASSPSASSPPPPSPAVPRRELFRAALMIKRDLARRRTANHLGAMATLHLLKRRPGAAVSLLEEAVTAAPGDPRMWSDLAAAYLLRGAMGATASDIVHALAAADQAVLLGPRLGEARVNQALALERLFLSTEARAAWCGAVSWAPTEAWRNELRRRCGQGESPSLPDLWQTQVVMLRAAALRGDATTVEHLVAANTQAARELVMEDLLLRWGSAVLAGTGAEAARSLQISRAIGIALANVGTDHTVADAVEVLDHLPPKMLPRAARACVSYVEGRRLYREIDIESAAPRLAEAAREFATLRSPMALWARLWLSGIAFHHGDFDIALERLRALLSSPGIGKYPVLVALAHWLMGATFLRAGQLAAAAESYRDAVHHLSGTGEQLNLAGIYSLLSEALDYLGQSRDSWSHRQLALGLLRFFPGSVPWQNLMRDCARVVAAAGERAAALHFENEAVRAARRTGSSVLTTHSLLQRGRIEGRLGRTQEALVDLQAAHLERDRITGATLRERLGYDLAAAAGEIDTAAPLGARIDRLSLAIDYYTTRQRLDLELAPLLLGRARLYVDVGEESRAEADLDRGIEIAERQRSRLVDPELRLTILDTTTQVFDEMILFQLERRRDPAAAFAYAERARTALSGLSLAGDVGGGGEHLAHLRGRVLLAALSKALEKRVRPTVVVEYTVLPHELLIWTVDRRKSGLVRVHANIDALRWLIRRFLDQLRAGAPATEVEALAGNLFEQLIAPVSNGTPAGAELVIVPDKFLNALPFGALWDSRSGRYLLEIQAIALCPQAAALIARTPGERPAVGQPGRALLVGNPSFDRRKFPWLADLPFALEEVSQIAALYPASTVLAGAGATRTRFLQQMRSAAVLHFAGHALAGNGDPGGAQLVLAATPAPEEPDVVSARELLAEHIPKAGLVVLSACETAVPDASRSGGLFGLAHPFLASGASVVGSLWRVDDLAALSVFPAFHRHYLQGGSAAESLRSALLPLVRAPTGARSDSMQWAAYCVIQRN